jgi:hypothetical protein
VKASRHLALGKIIRRILRRSVGEQAGIAK